MTDQRREDDVQFDDAIALALAQAADAGHGPRDIVKQRLMASLIPKPVPAGFAFQFAAAAEWRPHPVPGIRMQVLAENREADYAMLLLDVAPGTRFPPHHHGGAEECYVISGTVETCDRRMTAGDFLHADAGTDHGELFTPDGCRVILVVSGRDYIPDPGM
jgi:anti-sigma factor ChrR (cupin superfamily)